MSDEPSPIITKDQVRAVLASLYSGRSKRDGRHYVRSILYRHGGGATSINDLDPFYYGAVIAAVTIPTPADFYGTVTDVQPAPAPTNKRNNTPASSRARIRSPLVAELEARLKERAGKPRSKPSGRVDYGAPVQFGDQADDAPQPEYPAGERMS